MKVLVVAFALLFLLPIAFAAGQSDRPSDVPWYAARRDASGQAPDPKVTQEAVIQVYAARAVGWRRALAVHTWIAVKPSGADRYTRYEVMGWGVDQGAPSVRVDRTGPDNFWFGAYPERLVDLRGAGVDALIAKIDAAVERYPYPKSYLTWPGPNSNTFTAFVAREVPELGLALPPTAIGKDYLAGGALIGAAPSGTGVQFSLFGLAGVTLAKSEGVEINLFGLTFGVSAFPPALKLPGVGSLG
ncbi:MAG: DUF3750 domain-containing protein [Alphaproteobacteria bacterium]|nr:DUF3750 domain-containing protein [Alphaproteobacteria bacterium]